MRARVRERCRLLQLALDIRGDLVQPLLGHAVLLDDLPAEEDDRVAGQPFRDFVRRPVGTHVALVVSPVPVGLRLDQRRPLAGTCAADRLARDPQRLQYVVSVRDHAGHRVGIRAHRDVLDRLVLVLAREFSVEVIFADVDGGEVPQRRKVERLVKRALVGRPVAEEGDGHGAGAAPLELERGARGERDARTDDSIRAEEAELRVDHVQRTTLGAVVPVSARVQLGVHPPRVGAPGEHVPVTAVRACDRVVRPKRGAHAHGHRLLSDRRMQEAGDEAGESKLRGAFLEPADQHEQPVKVDQSLRRQRRFVHTLILLTQMRKPPPASIIAPVT